MASHRIQRRASHLLALGALFVLQLWALWGCTDDNPYYVEPDQGLGEADAQPPADVGGAELDAAAVEDSGGPVLDGQPPLEDAQGPLEDAQGPLEDAQGPLEDATVEEGCAEGSIQPCGSSVGTCVLGRQVCGADGQWGACEGGVGPSEEICDGLDNNCDGRVDEGCECITDATRPCGSNIGACELGLQTCGVDGRWGECVGGAGPSEEICDGLDNNCDGRVDEGCDCAEGDTLPCGSDVGVCEKGMQTCDGGQWSECVGGVGPSEELCDGLDNNCDGRVDEDCECITDATRPCGSNIGACELGLQTCGVDGRWGECVGGAGPSEEICDGLDNNCDGRVDEGCDCAEGDTLPCGSDVGVCEKGVQTCGADGEWGECVGGVGPSEEICDGLDNNCDGEVDEGCECQVSETRPCGSDVGVCEKGMQTCDGGQWSECVGGVGPSEEICDGLDNNCDGVIDEGCECRVNETRPCGSSVGVCEKGMQTCDGGQWGECVGGVGPSEEICDGLDNNCDGVVDEGCDCQANETRPCGSDVGVCVKGVQTCSIAGEWGECVGGVGPSEEICDGLDNNCDGVVDEGCDCQASETRPCGSDVGVCVKGAQTCSIAGEWGECVGGVGPSEEICDGLDNNCDGEVDEGCECQVSETQRCGSNVGACTFGEQICGANGQWGACEGGVEPSEELCGDEIDNNCDGSVDEGCDCSPGSVQRCGFEVGACRAGWQRCGHDRTWGFCEGVIGPTEELCDGVDNNCDGSVDEGCDCVGEAARPCGSDVGVCTIGWQRCNYQGVWGLCEDAVFPSLERCDGFDNNCDGQVDEDLLEPCFTLLETVVGSLNEPSFASQLVATVDAAGDGHPDVLVRTSDSRVSLIDGADGTVLWTVSENGGFGTSLAQGRFGPNGEYWYAVGAPGRTSYGLVTGAVYFYNAQGVRVAQYYGDTLGSGRPGASLATVSVGNRDLLVIGEPQQGTFNAGRVIFVYFTPGSPPVWNVAYTTNGNLSGQRLGTRVHAIADVDGDGHNDVMVVANASSTAKAYVLLSSQGFALAAQGEHPANAQLAASNLQLGSAWVGGHLLPQLGYADAVSITQPSSNGRQLLWLWAQDPSVGNPLQVSMPVAITAMAILPRPAWEADTLLLGGRTHERAYYLNVEGVSQLQRTKLGIIGERAQGLGHAISVSEVLPDGTYRVFIGAPSTASARGEVRIYSAR